MNDEKIEVAKALQRSKTQRNSAEKKQAALPPSSSEESLVSSHIESSLNSSPSLSPIPSEEPQIYSPAQPNFIVTPSPWSVSPQDSCEPEIESDCDDIPDSILWLRATPENTMKPIEFTMTKPSHHNLLLFKPRPISQKEEELTYSDKSDNESEESLFPELRSSPYSVGNN